jgi:hypothetical protein
MTAGGRVFGVWDLSANFGICFKNVFVAEYTITEKTWDIFLNLSETLL